MKLYRAHDGLSLSLPAPPAATSSLDDLLDCLSLATGIQTDNIICMTADGTQLHPDNYRILLSLDPPDLEFFIYNREYLYTDPKQLALQLAVQTHLEQPLSHIDELPEPGTPYYASAVLPWALHALSLIRTHASRAHLAHTALSNMHRASAIALANLLQYTRTIAAGAHALDTSVGAELTRMKDLLDSYERDLNLLGMVPINPRLLNPSSSRDSTSAQGATAAAVAAGGKPSSASPASTPSSHGHGMSSAAPAIPTKRLGDYVQRQRMSAVAAACARVHAELATRFVKIHHHLHALQTDVNSLESEVNAVDLGAASDEAQTAREARQRAEDIVERGLGPWLSGNLAENEEEHRHLIEQGYLPPFPLGPNPAEGGQQDNPEAAAGNMLIEYDQDRLHSQLEEALTELVLLDEVTRASVLRLSQDRNDMQARIITFLQDISAVQSDLGELAEAMDVFEKEEMPPGAGVRQAVQAQRFAQAQAREQNQVKLAHNSSPAFVLDGFRPSMAPVAVAAAGAGAGIGAAPPPSSSSSTTQPGQPIRADGFRHLARLHHMLLAYGATLIELVRRATFSRLFLKSAQSVAELMALVSEREVERRKEWRKAGVSSMLPWDVRALSLVPMSGSAAGGGGGNMGASAFGDEGTPMLEISTKGMALLHAASGAGSSGFDPLSAALASAAELGRDDVDKLFTLLDDIERALEQEADLARESEVAVSLRRQSSALRQHGAAAAAAGGFALPHQGQRSPATPPHAFQSPASQGLPLPPVNPIPEVRAALRMLVDEIDDMEPEFKDLVNVTLLERRSRFRRRHSTRRTATQGESGAEGEEEQGSEADDVDSDEEDEAELGSVLNGGNRQTRTQGPRASRRALRQQLKELTARIEEAEGAASSAQVSLEAAQTENARLRSDLAHLSEEHHHAYGAIRLELENVRAESRSNAEAYDRARHSRDDALAQIDTLRNDVDTEAARRLNLEEEITNVRKDMKEARREEVEAKREALELEERLAELDVQTSELQNELENAVKAREDVCNRMEGLLKEGSSAEQELASAQTRIEELNRETSAARTEVREAKEALAEAESARDKLIRTYRAEADGDRAILEENVRNKEQELRLAKEGLKNADTARKAAEAREAAERTVSDGLRGQLEAADVTHESMLRDLEEAREEGSKLETRLRDAMDERDELLRLVRPVMGKIQALRKIIKAMPVPQSSSSKSTAEKEGKTGSGPGGGESTAHERASSATSTASEPVNGSSSHGAGSAVTVKGSNGNGNGVLNAALEAFENEGENDASLATTLSALRALEPRHFHDEVKGKLDSLTTLVRKWQKAYKGTGEKISRAQSSARDRIAYRNFQVGDLVLFLPTRNTSARTFAAFNRGFPHYFLRAEGSFGEQIRNKDYLLDRITAVTERVAGPAPAGGAGDVSADGTNPYQLTEGVRYHILDVEGALNNNGGSSLSSAPQTPKRMGGMPPRSVSHGPPSRRDSSVTTASSATSVISPPAPLLPASIPASSHAATPSTSVNAPSGLTLSRSTSRSFDRLASTLAESEQGVGATGGSSTATITALNSFGGGLSPSEVGSSASIPVPAFGTRARAGLKRRAPGDGSGEVGVGSTGVSPGSGGPTSIVPAVPMPISMPRGGSGNSSLDNNGEHHLQRLPYNRATGSSGGGMGPTVAELERGLKNPATSRAIAEALAAEGLQSIGNPFSASPGGAGSLVERRPSFGGRASIPNSSVSSRGGLSATGTATTTVASPLRANTAVSAARRREGSSSSSSNVSNVSNLSRARREGGAFRRPGAASSGMATPTRAGFYPSRGQIGRVGSTMDTSPSAASPALAVESLATARGETSLLAVASGGRADGGFWRTESQSPGLDGMGSPRLSAEAGPSWARSNMASPSPSPATRMQRQLSSEGGSGFSSDLLSPMPTPGRGMLGLVGTRPSNSSDVSQTSDVAFPRTRSHTGGGGGTSIASNTNRNSLPASRKDSFSSGFLSSLTFGRASARKQSLQGPQSRLLAAAEGEDAGRMSAAATAGQTTGPRRSTLEMILGWPGSSSGTAMPPPTTATSGKGKRAVRGSVSEGGPLGVEGEGEMSALEVGSPGSEAGSATAAEMLRRLARTTS